MFPDNYPVDTWGQLCVALGGSEDSFTGMLLTLMNKADPGNRVKLSRAYPREYEALQWWKITDGPKTAGDLRRHQENRAAAKAEFPAAWAWANEPREEK